jgi:hypothetical protein
VAGNFEMQLNSNCTVPAELDWSDVGPKGVNQHLFGTWPANDESSGSYDPATRSGSVAGKGDAMIFDTQHTGGP